MLAFDGPEDKVSHQVCKGCGVDRPIEAFRVKPCEARGRSYRCMICERYNAVLHTAKVKSLVADLTREQIELITTSKCIYCGEQGTQLSPIGVDRIDNDSGYQIHNVVPCCIKCNGMKSRMSFADFQAHVARIAGYLRCTLSYAENDGS